MQMCHRTGGRLLVLMLLVLFAAGLCEQNQSRRALAEHQLMHDRGRNIQSLKRLIWLSGAMEGLHTAQSRWRAPRDAAALVHNLLRNVFNSPYGTRVARREA